MKEDTSKIMPDEQHTMYIPDRLKEDKNWTRKRAVALIYEAMRRSLRSKRTLLIHTVPPDMNMETPPIDVTKNISRLRIPKEDELYDQGGIHPFIHGLDEDGRAILQVEVETFDDKLPDNSKTSLTSNMECVVVYIRGFDDLHEIVEPDPPTPGQPINTIEPCDPVAIDGEQFSTQGNTTISRANQDVQSLINALSYCSPEMRRKLKNALKNTLEPLDLLHPIRPDNPLFKELGYSAEIYKIPPSHPGLARENFGLRPPK